MESTILPRDGRGEYVWLIWAATPNRCDLAAIATSEEIRDGYMETCKAMYPGAVIYDEPAAVDHLYARKGFQKVVNDARLRRES